MSEQLGVNDYDWFFAILDENGGWMDTDYATLNYVELSEINYLVSTGQLFRHTYATVGEDIISRAAKDYYLLTNRAAKSERRLQLATQT